MQLRCIKHTSQGLHSESGYIKNSKSPIDYGLLFFLRENPHSTVYKISNKSVKLYNEIVTFLPKAALKRNTPYTEMTTWDVIGTVLWKLRLICQQSELFLDAQFKSMFADMVPWQEGEPDSARVFISGKGQMVVKKNSKMQNQSLPTMQCKITTTQWQEQESNTTTGSLGL